MKTETDTETEITLADFMAKHGVTVRFVPTHVDQEQQSQFKTWQLHYSAVVTVGNHTETFTFHAGYGCAMTEETRAKIKRELRNSSSFRGRAFDVQIGQYFLNEQADASRLRDQSEVRKFMNWLLRHWSPDAASLLNSLKLDASLGENNFHDFCGEIGYDEDSRKAESTWRECQESGRKLRGLIGHVAFAELLSNTESL